jgi:hypothetical protein
MQMTKEILDQQFFEMRWRCLSLAADLDRLQRAEAADSRLQTLRQGIEILLTSDPNRAEKIQSLFSDKTPPPPHR